MNRKAFTLIELLVVVAIIGILAAVGVVAYNGYTSAAKRAVVKSNHKMIVNLINADFKKCEMGETHLKIKSWHLAQNINDVECRKNTGNMVSAYRAHFINEGVNDPYNINQFGIVFGCDVPNLGQTSLCYNGNIITVKSVYQNSNGNNESMTSTVIDER